MAVGRISARSIQAVSSGDVAVYLWDSELKGFGLKVTPAGRRVFIVQYRLGGRRTPTRRETLGALGKLTPDEARREAKRILAKAAMGLDPKADREGSSKTVKDLCQNYLRASERGEVRTRLGRPKRATTLAVDRGRIERHILPLLGKKSVSQVKCDDIQRFVAAVARGDTAADIKTGPRGRAIVTGGEGTAARTVGLLGGIFSYAAQVGLRADNPCKGVRRSKDKHKDRRLDADEYQRLGQALRDLENQYPTAVTMIRLLALTGCRKGEVEQLRLEEVDRGRQCLVLHDSKTGKSFRPIGRPAMDVLDSALKVHGSAFVFASARGRGYYRGLPKVFAAICAKSGLTGVTLHTLRHSFASTAVDLEYAEATIASLLGHSRRSITSRYAHPIDSLLVAAADRISKSIARQLAGKGAAVRFATGAANAF